MLITQSEKFQKFEFKFLAGISSNTCQAKIQKIGGTVGITVLSRSKPVAMLEDVSAVEPSSLCPDPSRATWEETEDTARTPSLLLLPLCKLPTAVTSPALTHSTPQPRQHPSSTPPRPPCPAWPLHTARAPAMATFWPPLPSASRAYKNPPSTPRRSTHSPQPIPTLLSSSLPRRRPISVSVRRRVPGDSGHRWSCCWYEVEERSRHRRSATPPSSSASSPSRPRRRTLVPANAGEPYPSRGRRRM
jgi:hypothetical protein